MKTTTSAAMLVLVLAVATGDACADLVWRSPATLAPLRVAGGDQRAANAGGHGGHGGGAETLQLLESDGARVELWMPDLKRDAVIVAGDTLTLPWTGWGNYHAVVAQRDSAALHESAIRYAYLHGEPSGRSPSELLAVSKLPLEIVPSPLAREHHRYLADREAHFLIRYGGQPLAATVSLETSNGSVLEAQSDADGRVAIRLPDDFHRVQVGRRNNRPADFIVRVAYTANDRQYRASLSAAYHVNPHHWESNRAGLVAAVSGFAVGLGILGVTARQRMRGNGGRGV